MPASMPPAAPSRWPVIDLVDDTPILSACSPNSVRMASVSSLSLKGVDVPWALMYCTSSGRTPADSQGHRHHAHRAVAVLGRRRDVERVGGRAVADDLGVDAGAAPARLLEFLEDEDAGSLADDEAVPVLVERAARPLRARRCGSRARAWRRSRRRPSA